MKALVVGLGTLVLSVGIARAEAPPSEPKVGNEALSQSEQDPWDKGVTPEQKQAAAAAYREANKDFNDGLGNKAIEQYRQALKLWPHPAIHYNLALALLDMKKPVDAEEHLKKSIEHGLRGLNNQESKLEQAEKYLKLLADQLATVEVTCEKPGAKVSVDGKHVFTVEKGGPNKYKSRVIIGKHTFVAEKPGYATPVDAPFIGAGETFRIELKLYTAEELTRYKRRWEQRTWAPWVVIGGGVLVGAVGGIMQWSASSSYDKFDAEVARCTASAGDGSCDASAFTNLKDSGDTKRTMGMIGYGLAGAAVVTGGLLVYLNRRVAYQITTDQYRMEELRKQQKAQKQISIAPIVGPGAGGAVVMGRF